jgi:dienelactone hydrolase
MFHRMSVFETPCMSLLALAGIALAACSSDAGQSAVTPAPGAASATPAMTGTPPPIAAPGPATTAGNPMQPAGTVPAPAAPAPVTPAPAATPAAPTEGTDVAGGAPAAPAPFVEPEYTDGPLEGSCPEGFMPRSGMNSGFQSDDKMREFVVYLPTDMSTPRPVFVGITGTEQQSDAFISAAGLNALTRDGWIVMAPVRLCTTEGRQQECLNGVGESTMDGWVWEPWNDGAADPMGKWNDDAGQDVRFLENMVRCAAKQWPVDNRRIFLGGISAGGSFTNRNLTFNSKFWAGGVPASGMWYISAGNDSVTSANAVPVTEIQMYSSIAIVLFGGANDNYTTRGDMPIRVEYKPEAQASSNFYDSKDNVAVVTCQGSQGHLWPGGAAWDTWMATTLASHPKGTPKASFKLMGSPSGFRCNVGRYTDLF